MAFRSKTQLKYIRLFVLLSLLGSVVSYFTVAGGWGELYPFFYWKLYTQPLGNTHAVGEYRIYSRNKDDRYWKRETVAPTATFTHDEYVYTLNYLAGKQLQAPPTDTLAAHKLLTFIRHVAPGSDQYKVVLEQYAPRQHLQNPSAYDTTTVISF